MKRIALLLTAALALIATSAGINGARANAMNPSGATQVQDTTVLGKLYFVNLKEGEKPVMTALSLFGNRCGSEDFNHKPYAAEGIRSVFELDEWIEFHPQASVGTGIKVMVFKHHADLAFYQKNTLTDEQRSRGRGERRLGLLLPSPRRGGAGLLRLRFLVQQQSVRHNGNPILQARSDIQEARC